MSNKYAAVIGNPISHSLSPILHNFLLQKYNIEAQYKAILVEKDSFTAQIDNLLNDSDLLGFNVTIPFKEEIFQLFSQRDYQISDQALAVRAINTVYKKNGEIFADNTDIAGFQTNLAVNSSNLSTNSALLLGAGGAAAATLYSLSSKFKKIYIYNRTKQKAENLVDNLKNVIDISNIIILDEVTAENLQNLDLIVNSTPIGMQNNLKHNFSLQSIENSNCHIYDLIYNPLLTPLLQEAKSLNLPIVTGIGMLIYQALPGFEYWFKQKPELNSSEVSQLIELLIKNF